MLCIVYRMLYCICLSYIALLDFMRSTFYTYCIHPTLYVACILQFVLLHIAYMYDIQIAADNAYIYIAVINIASSMWAVYGLIILKNTFSEALHNFNIGGKFISLQMVLLLSVIPNLFINILVQYQVIPCDTLFSSKARGESKNILHFVHHIGYLTEIN